MPRTAMLAAVLFTPVVAYACPIGSGGSCTHPTSPEAGLPAATEVVVGQTAPLNGIVDITIQGFAFSPSSLTITAGTTVRWTNLDAPFHTTTSTNGFFGPGQPAPNGVFNSGSLATNATFSYTFNDLGTFNYYCLPHPSAMQASVTVIPEPSGMLVLSIAGLAALRRTRRSADKARF